MTAARAGDKRLSGGHTIDQWATDVLAGLRVPITKTNVAALVTWANHESGGYNPSVSGGMNNPLNTTESSVCRSDVAWPHAGACRNGGSQGNIKDYSTYEQGVAAIVHNLSTPAFGYPAIVAALKKGNDAQAVFVAVDASQFGTHGLAGSRLVDVNLGPVTIPAPGPDVGLNIPNPVSGVLDATQALGSVAAHLIDPAFWKRIGVFVLGGWVFLAGLYIVFKDTAPVKALGTVAKDAATAAAVA